MDRDRVYYDVPGSKRSNSRQLSEAHSCDKEERLNAPCLERSVKLDRPHKPHFFLSMELNDCMESPARTPLMNSPSMFSVKNYLSKFSRRFDALKTGLLEEEGPNGSPALSAVRIEPFTPREKKDLILLNEVKSTSSRPRQETASAALSSSPRGGRPAEGRAEAAPRREEISLASKKIKKAIRSKQKHIGSEDGPAARGALFAHLQRVYEAFFGLFSRGRLEPGELALAAWEEEIFAALVQRKYFHKLTAGELALPPERKAERVNEILNSRSNKRPEECYKFILTRVHKFLKRQFFRLKENKGRDEEAFYRHYFGEAAERGGLPLEKFYYPLAKHPHQKAMLNNDYFARICRSPRFLAELQAFLERRLLDEYRDELKQKLISLLTRFELMFEERLSSPDGITRQLREYLLKNKRCKLPWTVKEINESVQRFSLLLEQLTSQDPAEPLG